MPDISTPKLCRDDKQGYGYYAGFSGSFVETVLQAWGPGSGTLVLDPWNGSGTTTSAALSAGYDVAGFDLNPVAIVLARGSLLDGCTAGSLRPLAQEILAEARISLAEPYGDQEPLQTWLMPLAALRIRRIEAAIQRLLLQRDKYAFWESGRHVERFSTLAAFFYKALFRSLRRFLLNLVGSNPTWIKSPPIEERLDASFTQLEHSFLSSVDALARRLCVFGPILPSHTIALADSRSIPLHDAAADFVVTSPPYCTRLDYVVATAPELAMLGCRPRIDSEDLRRQMLGSNLIEGQAPEPSDDWGPECLHVLAQIRKHPSKASDTYYVKFFTQYFAGLFSSLQELRRVVRRSGSMVLVLQDSHYKDILVPVATIASQMTGAAGWSERDRCSFPAPSPIVRINSRARRYVQQRDVRETVLLFSQA